MPKSDLYVAPGRDEAAKLSRSAALLARSMGESDDQADQANAVAYHLVSEMWRLISEGVQTAAGAIALLREAAAAGDVDAGAVQGGIDQMESVFLRGYKDTIAAVPVAAPRRDPAADVPAPEPARAMSLAEIHFLRAQMNEPAAPEPVLSDEDLERSARQIAAVSQIRQGFAPGPRPRPRR
jgi:hypothetical protein